MDKWMAGPCGSVDSGAELLPRLTEADSGIIRRGKRVFAEGRGAGAAVCEGFTPLAAQLGSLGYDGQLRRRPCRDGLRRRALGGAELPGGVAEGPNGREAQAESESQAQRQIAL